MIRRVAIAAATAAALVAIVVVGGRIFGGAEWVDARGRSADGFVAERAGSDHCSWAGVPLLVVGHPLGTRFGPATRFYLRDAGGRLAREGILNSTFSATGKAPADAAPTGYRHGTTELWRGPDRGDEAVYLVERKGGSAERWPRLKDEVLCK